MEGGRPLSSDIQCQWVPTLHMNPMVDPILMAFLLPTLRPPMLRHPVLTRPRLIMVKPIAPTHMVIRINKAHTHRALIPQVLTHILYRVVARMMDTQAACYPTIRIRSLTTLPNSSILLPTIRTNQHISSPLPRDMHSPALLTLSILL